eukprot:g5713.t1
MVRRSRTKSPSRKIALDRAKERASAKQRERAVASVKRRSKRIASSRSRSRSRKAKTSSRKSQKTKKKRSRKEKQLFVDEDEFFDGKELTRRTSNDDNSIDSDEYEMEQSMLRSALRLDKDVHDNGRSPRAPWSLPRPKGRPPCSKNPIPLSPTYSGPRPYTFWVRFDWNRGFRWGLAVTTLFIILALWDPVGTGGIVHQNSWTVSHYAVLGVHDFSEGNVLDTAIIEADQKQSTSVAWEGDSKSISSKANIQNAVKVLSDPESKAEYDLRIKREAFHFVALGGVIGFALGATLGNACW